MEILNTIFQNVQQGKPMPMAVRNAEYHLCMDDQNALLFLSYWRMDGKQMPLSLRNAKEGVEGCMVITLQDTNGNAIPLLTLAATKLEAKIYGKLNM